MYCRFVCVRVCGNKLTTQARKMITVVTRAMVSYPRATSKNIISLKDHNRPPSRINTQETPTISRSSLICWGTSEEPVVSRASTLVLVLWSVSVCLRGFQWDGTRGSRDTACCDQPSGDVTPGLSGPMGCVPITTEAGQFCPLIINTNAWAMLLSLGGGEINKPRGD